MAIEKLPMGTLGLKLGQSWENWAAHVTKNPQESECSHTGSQT